MAKYAMTTLGTVLSVSEHGIWPNLESTVVVVPEADWRRLVELVQMEDLTPHHEAWCLCKPCKQQAEVGGIIQRTQEANNG